MVAQLCDPTLICTAAAKLAKHEPVTVDDGSFLAQLRSGLDSSGDSTSLDITRSDDKRQIEALSRDQVARPGLKHQSEISSSRPTTAEDPQRETQRYVREADTAPARIEFKDGYRLRQSPLRLPAERYGFFGWAIHRLSYESPESSVGIISELRVDAEKRSVVFNVNPTITMGDKPVATKLNSTSVAEGNTLMRQRGTIPTHPSARDIGVFLRGSPPAFLKNSSEILRKRLTVIEADGEIQVIVRDYTCPNPKSPDQLSRLFRVGAPSLSVSSITINGVTKPKLGA